MIPAIPSGVIGEGRLSCELAVGLPGELRHRAQPSLPHSALIGGTLTGLASSVLLQLADMRPVKCLD